MFANLLSVPADGLNCVLWRSNPGKSLRISLNCKVIWEFGSRKSTSDLFPLLKWNKCCINSPEDCVGICMNDSAHSVVVPLVMCTAWMLISSGSRAVCKYVLFSFWGPLLYSLFYKLGYWNRKLVDERLSQCLPVYIYTQVVELNKCALYVTCESAPYSKCSSSSFP